MRDSQTLEKLSAVANRLRLLSVQATSAAGSGHPSSCASAADLVAALFFAKMRFRPNEPHYPNNDRFILSKGHAAPLLYAAWAETGHLDEQQLKTLRRFDSPLEGHPTPRLDFVDVATGSLGQGLSAGVGMAINAYIQRLDYRTYVLLGDGEMAEGSVWEAASLAAVRRLDNLVAIVDANRLGQSGPTAFAEHADVYTRRFDAFGWRAVTIDGHDIRQIVAALDLTDRRPLAIVARTIKGKGIAIMEDQEHWHGKPVPADALEQVTRTLSGKSASAKNIAIPMPSVIPTTTAAVATPGDIHYARDAKVSTRKAFGNALARLGKVDRRIVVIDGDVKNSTYTETFANVAPERFIEGYIGEQNMVGMAAGLAALGQIPFVSTFAAFFSRAGDQLRMAGISKSNLKLVGTHAGVATGEDGPSQMGLEDFADFRAIMGSVVLSASDAVCAERLVEEMLHHRGLVYLRTARPEVPIIYNNDEVFPLGGAKVLRHSERDKLTLVATGITVFEALSAYETLRKQGLEVAVVDAYCLKPLPAALILELARQRGMQLVSVEDHYSEGGLGEALAGTLSAHGVRVHKLAVTELPRSGRPKELFDAYRIDARAIVDEVVSLSQH